MAEMCARGLHNQRFDGDDPYLICDCGMRWDALTGSPLTPAPTPDPLPDVGPRDPESWKSGWNAAVKAYRDGEMRLSTPDPLRAPTTPAGRALLEGRRRTDDAPRMFVWELADHILAIEAEARTDLLDRLASEVRELPMPNQYRLPVLALIEEARK